MPVLFGAGQSLLLGLNGVEASLSLGRDVRYGILLQDRSQAEFAKRKRLTGGIIDRAVQASWVRDRVDADVRVYAVGGDAALTRAVYDGAALDLAARRRALFFSEDQPRVTAALALPAIGGGLAIPCAAPGVELREPVATTELFTGGREAAAALEVEWRCAGGRKRLVWLGLARELEALGIHGVQAQSRPHRQIRAVVSPGERFDPSSSLGELAARRSLHDAILTFGVSLGIDADVGPLAVRSDGALALAVGQLAALHFAADCWTIILGDGQHGMATALTASAVSI
jgi:hypothetical protein